MNVSLKTFMPVAAAGLLGLSACSDVKESLKILCRTGLILNTQN